MSGYSVSSSRVLRVTLGERIINVADRYELESLTPYVYYLQSQIIGILCSKFVKIVTVTLSKLPVVIDNWYPSGGWLIKIYGVLFFWC